MYNVQNAMTCKYDVCICFREPGIPGQLSEPVTASVPVVHNILELKVSVEVSQSLIYGLM